MTIFWQLIQKKYVKQFQIVLWGVAVSLPVHSMGFDFAAPSESAQNISESEKELTYYSNLPGLPIKLNFFQAKTIQDKGVKTNIVIAQSDPAGDEAAKHIGDEVGAYLRREGYIESGKYHDKEGYRKSPTELKEEKSSSGKDKSNTNGKSKADKSKADK